MYADVFKLSCQRKTATSSSSGFIVQKVTGTRQLADMPTHGLKSWTTCRCHQGMLAPPGEYDWTIRLGRRCGLMSKSNYIDHLLLCSITVPPRV